MAKCFMSLFILISTKKMSRGVKKRSQELSREKEINYCFVLTGRKKGRISSRPLNFFWQMQKFIRNIGTDFYTKATHILGCDRVLRHWEAISLFIEPATIASKTGFQSPTSTLYIASLAMKIYFFLSYLLLQLKDLTMNSRLKVKVFIRANHQPDPEWKVLAGEQGTREACIRCFRDRFKSQPVKNISQRDIWGFLFFSCD